MINTNENMKKAIGDGGFDGSFKQLYTDLADARSRYIALIDGFSGYFGERDNLRLFSAPGRTELGGNHTDHQKGNVLAASVGNDIIAAVSENGSSIIRIKSEGHEVVEVDLNDLGIKESEKEDATALVRGISARITELGYNVTGFDAYTTSRVLNASGMSSSAAFEILCCTIINYLFAGEKLSAIDMSLISKYAENVYFGKPCGLLDQLACSVGGIAAMDFSEDDNPTIEQIKYDFESTGHVFYIVNTRGNHGDLTYNYADIPNEMRSVAAYFGKEVLGQCTKQQVMESIPQLRKAVSDRAILRAVHFFNDCETAKREAEALKQNKFDEFLRLIKKSGRSSYMYLQNVYSPDMPQTQDLSLALMLSDEVLGERGAYRVHGGGFAGTIQAFVPQDMVETYVKTLDGVFGEGSCLCPHIRNVGSTELVCE